MKELELNSLVRLEGRGNFSRQGFESLEINSTIWIHEIKFDIGDTVESHIVKAAAILRQVQKEYNVKRFIHISAYIDLIGIIELSENSIKLLNELNCAIQFTIMGDP